MNQKITRGKLTFSISPLPMRNKFKMSISETDFPARLGGSIFHVDSLDNLPQSIEEQMSKWLIEYTDKSPLQKNLDKFFSLQDLNKNIQYKLYLMAEEDAHHKLGLQSVYDETNKLERSNHLMAFLFVQIFAQYDKAVALVRSAYEADEGDRIDKLVLLAYFRDEYANQLE